MELTATRTSVWQLHARHVYLVAKSISMSCLELGEHLEMLDALVGVRQQVGMRVRRATDVGDALRLLSLQLALHASSRQLAQSSSNMAP